MSAVLFVNFGGPRSLDEVEPFLCELLCDRELLRTPFPPFFHSWFFQRIARKRAPKVRPDYELIGGKSPIYDMTEALAKRLQKSQQKKVLTFHRYLPSTHRSSLDTIEQCDANEILVFPFFPQFSSATTGSIATFFQKHLSLSSLNKLRWIRSYPTHPFFIQAWKQKISSFLKDNELQQEDCYFLFSAHGIPQSFVKSGDSYEQECQASYEAIRNELPINSSLLCYQSKFGKGEWIKPYTDEVCEKIQSIALNKKAVVFIPLAFTSDHIETLFEIEQLYLPVIRKQGYLALRCSCLNESPLWFEAIKEMLHSEKRVFNRDLVRKNWTLSLIHATLARLKKMSI